MSVVDFDEKQFEKNQKAFADVLARYYGDPDFKAQMDTDPTKTLVDAGIDIPEGTEVELLFNTDEVIHIVLPYIEDE